MESYTNRKEVSSMKLLCECNGDDCQKTIDLPLEEAQRIEGLKRVIIVDGCPTGPEPTDVLVSKETGYTIYKED